MPFLPITPAEMQQRGWSEPDIVVVTGDAYVDHPSFGAAIISRVLEAEGFRVCVLPQPQSAEDMRRFGTPRLGFFVGSGNIDSMVAQRGCLPPRRQSRPPARQGGDRLLPLGAAVLSRYPDCARRAGGVAAPLCPLRLLG